MEIYRFNGSRNAYVETLKIIREYGSRPTELTELEHKILLNEERLRLKLQFFKIYQLGDPQEIEDLYQETCDLIDRGIEERRYAEQNCKLE